MAGNSSSLIRRLDWLLIAVSLLLIAVGWMNIYSAINVEDRSVFDISQRYGMHLLWIGISVVIDALILFAIPEKFWSAVSWWGYILMIALLLAVLVIGVEIKGSKSWISLGAINIQPAEFSKITTSLALSLVMSKYGFSFKNFKDAALAFATMITPILLILLERETGLALVYVAFLFVFFREGMSGWWLLLGAMAILLFVITLAYSPFIALLTALGTIWALIVIESKESNLWLLAVAAGIAVLSFLPKLLAVEFVSRYIHLSAFEILAIIVAAVSVFLIVRLLIRNPRAKLMRNALLSLICFIGLIYSVEFIFEKVLQDHQRARIEVLLGIKEDPSGVGYNVHQSMVAIGSGGLTGKGYMNGTQTRFNFVPEQETDFIFCTIGEEWGFLGALFILASYFFIIARIIYSAEKNRNNFTRIYGYCVAMCLAVHVVINLSMTIGLMPVIGIPLPFLSYGGSSLLAFSILLFIFIRLDAER
ncbi:MAG: rod shape-determining protein RodA [Bacteroidales bacterium]|nr:rod shape-determining protein RodA [Bacteroidales bacterium]